MAQVSDKGVELISKVADAIPCLTDYEKGYIEGITDRAIKDKEKENTEKEVE